MTGREMRDKAAWYVGRLRSMRAGEVLARAWRQSCHLLDAGAWHAAKPLWRLSWERSDERLLPAPIGSTPNGFLTRERALGLLERYPERGEAIVEAAEQALAGRVRFFGYPEVQLPRPVDFSRDALTGRSWPDRHAKLIDYRRSAPGNPKWIWELNRLQQLPLLAEAWLLTGGLRFADEAVQQCVDWLGAQRPGRGIAWSSGFEAGIRAVSLGLTFDALRGTPPMTESRAKLILHGLDQHARWILRDPSTHSSANNHAIGELAGLAAIALLAPELRDAQTWRVHALRRLAEEAKRQILPDGTGAEQAFAYQLFVLDLLLLVVSLLDCAGLAVPAEISSALERSADSLWAQLGRDDPAPTYGDADDGRAMRLEPFDLRDARGVAASLAARLGHQRARTVAQDPDATAWWLFGEEGATTFASTLPAPPPGSAALPDGGLVALRRDGRRTMVDVGSLGYLSLAAHGHADALQVTVADEGEELIVDPGTGSYFGHPQWRRGFRGTAFHPTVTVDGLDQSDAGGPFLWHRHARAHAAHVALEDGYVVGEHDGYASLADPVRHRRVVAISPDGSILVYDRLDAAQVHCYRQSWPLHPSLKATERTPETVDVTRGGRPRLVVALAASSPASLRLAHGSDRPFEGWWSHRLEAIEPAWTCLWEATGNRVDLAALFLVIRDGSRRDVRLSLWSTDEGARVEIHAEDASLGCSIDLENSPRPVTWSPPEPSALGAKTPREGAHA